jgi:hypothetical protein
MARTNKKRDPGLDPGRRKVKLDLSNRNLPGDGDGTVRWAPTERRSSSTEPRRASFWSVLPIHLRLLSGAPVGMVEIWERVSAPLKPIERVTLFESLTVGCQAAFWADLREQVNHGGR